MASFFQSSLANPDTHLESKFIHLPAPSISAHALVQERWHIIVLLLGAGAVFAGGALQIFLEVHAREGWVKNIFLLPSQCLQIVRGAIFACRQPGRVQQSPKPRSGDGSSHAAPLVIFSNVKSFCITTTDQCNSLGCELHIRSICDEDFRQSGLGCASSTYANLSERTSQAPTLASLDTESLNQSQQQGSFSAIASSMHAWRLSRAYDGFLIRCGQHDDPATVDELLRELRNYNSPVVLRANADSHIWDGLDFDLVDGLLLENASVLPSGESRDYYRASRVRACAAHCKRQRSIRPGFFFGFVELWQICPSAAALRRAYKLADFFGASVLAMPLETPSDDGKRLKEMPLSGFDWLKNSDLVWLQKVWSTHSSFSFTEEPGKVPFQMDLSCMLDALPAVDRMLSLQPVTLDSASYTPRGIPTATSDMPSRVDIWHFASCGAELCAAGCYGLQDEIVQSQYDAVLTIQRSLKHNQLLRMYSEADNLRVRDSFGMQFGKSSYPELAQSLLKGLADQKIRIFAGLDSGFTLPDDGGHLWAVSDTIKDDSGSILDIYISLKVSNDIATIWHTFLAYSGVPRLQRYEEELLLSNKEQRLPPSIAKELGELSESELLYLVEQITISEREHPFNKAILEAAEVCLIQDTTIRAWNALHSRACLDGSISVRSLLEQRIAHLTRLGATSLPSLENLVILHEMLQQRLDTALRTCDRETLSTLTNPLLASYGHAGIEHPVPPSVDLYGLIFFTALRRLAFEDVYLETTDRCPLFLSQSDQAGVFAELWVLGSQCEIYFGVSPRTLGEIVFERYRLFLEQHPPPEDAWNGKEVFSAYSVPQISDEIPAAISVGSRQGRLSRYRRKVNTAGALSIFCVPAIIDVILLTFLGRGLYLTAFMNDELKLMADYAIMAALVMTSGVTGLVGSTGSFYLFNVSVEMARILTRNLRVSVCV
jgi:hypothetical protein